MKTYPEPSEVTPMERMATNLRDELLIHLLFHLGCRIGEALALTIEDFDFEHGIVTIKHLKASLKLSCTECGHRLCQSYTFCPSCGSRVTEAQVELQQRRRQRALPIDDGTLTMSTCCRKMMVPSITVGAIKGL